MSKNELEGNVTWLMTSSPSVLYKNWLLLRVISIRRRTPAGFKLTKLFGIDDFSTAKDFRKVFIIIIYCFYNYYYERKPNIVPRLLQTILLVVIVDQQLLLSFKQVPSQQPNRFYWKRSSSWLAPVITAVNILKMARWSQSSIFGPSNLS